MHTQKHKGSTGLILRPVLYGRSVHHLLEVPSSLHSLQGELRLGFFVLKLQTMRTIPDHHDLLEILQYLLFPQLLGGSPHYAWIRLNQIMHHSQWCLQAVDKRCQGKSLLRPTNIVLQDCETSSLNQCSFCGQAKV